jgi:hypothetical protein
VGETCVAFLSVSISCRCRSSLCVCAREFPDTSSVPFFVLPLLPTTDCRFLIPSPRFRIMDRFGTSGYGGGRGTGRGGGGYRGGFGGGGDREMGYCSVHRRRRSLAELIELADNPGQFKCAPHAQCKLGYGRGQQLGSAYAAGGDPPVTCCVHGRRRNRAQMKEVAPDVWECMEEHRCRQPMGGRDGMNPMAMPIPGVVGMGGSSAMVPGASYGNDTSSAVAAPSTNMGGVLPPVPTFNPYGQRSLTGAFSASAAAGGGYVPLVWCAKHGKRIQRSASTMVDSTYYVCRDEAACLADVLKGPEALQRDGCTELLCRNHGSLRRIAYLQLHRNAARAGYVCHPLHPCRYSAATVAGGIADDSNADADPSGLANPSGSFKAERDVKQENSFLN